MITDATILIVPGLREHVPDHWQTLLAASLSKVHTVAPLESDKLGRAARVDALDRALDAIGGPVILVAHSAGVMMVAHWASQSRRPIKGALLATPADVESPFPPAYPTTDTLHAHGWLPIPRRYLPFPSVLAASSNDPLCGFERAQEMAVDWGSQFEDLGPVGHLNPAAGYGAWPKALELIARLDAGQVSGNR